MSTDDPKPKRPARDEDPSYVTMPPELRAYDTGPLENKVIKPGDDPILDAAMAGIRVLDGDPNADPFYYDVKKRRADGKKGAGVGNVSAYVPPSSVPAASEVKPGDAASPKIVIEGTEDPLATRAIDVRTLRGRSPAARRVTGSAGEDATLDPRPVPASAANEKPPEAASSPWSKEAPSPDSVRASALPSSLQPRDVTAPAGEPPAPAPVRESPKAAVALVVALVVMALAIGARVLTTRRTPENAAPGPAPTATMTAGVPTLGPVMAPVPPPSAVPAPPPPASSTAPAAAPLPPSAAPAPERLRSAPRPSGTPEDPHANAAVKPIPTVTVAPVAPPEPPPPAPVPATGAPVAPAAPTTSSRVMAPTPKY